MRISALDTESEREVEFEQDEGEIANRTTTDSHPLAPSQEEVKILEAPQQEQIGTKGDTPSRRGKCLMYQRGGKEMQQG